MRAYELQARTGFDALARTTRRSRPIGPTDVRVRVRAVALNYRDLAIIRGADSRIDPVIPLSDSAGDVIAVGSIVTRVAVGDQVGSAFFPTWMDSELFADAHAHALGSAVDRVLAEEVTLDQDIPTIEHPNDAIVQVTCAAICGSDLHLYQGMMPDVRVGHTFGHEFVGTVHEVGSSVESLRAGDRVLVPFNICCGSCFFVLAVSTGTATTSTRTRARWAASTATRIPAAGTTAAGGVRTRAVRGRGAEQNSRVDDRGGCRPAYGRVFDRLLWRAARRHLRR